MRENNAIRALGKKVIYRIALFVLVYLSLVALGLLLLYIGYKWATSWGVGLMEQVFDSTNSGIVMLIIIGIYLGIIALCLMFGLFLLKFIFTRQSDEEDGRILVNENDCPQLFQLISEVAQATKCPMPHKVFLSTEINACVFFNTTFWSMFFPVRKNLVLGAGLFATTSTEEIKGILAHEFGHFSQESMKIGSVVYTANIVLGNLVYGEDAWDRWVDRWSGFEWSPFAIFGSLTRFFTVTVRLLLQAVYRYVNIAYRELSRQMEFDADNIACKVVGKCVMASSLYKTAVMMQCSSNTHVAMMRLDEKGKKADPFEILELLSQIKANEEGKTLEATQLLLAEVKTNDEPTARFSCKDVWDSHPSDRERIQQLQNIPRPSNEPLLPAWSIMPVRLRHNLGELIKFEHKTNENERVLITGDELKQWLEKELITELLDMRFRRFFMECGCIDLFNPMEETPAETVTYPFTKRNRNIVTAYIRAFEDAEQMIEIINGDLEVSAAYYKGKCYSPDELPTVEHSQYMEKMLPKLKNVYREIYTYLRAGKQGEVVERLYERLFLLNKYIESYQENIIAPAETMVETWNNGNKQKKDESALFSEYVQIFNELKGIVPSITPLLSDDFIANENCEGIVKLVNECDVAKLEAHNEEQMEDINECLRLLSPFLDVLQQQYEELKLTIGRIAQAEEEGEIACEENAKAVV